MVIKIMKGKDKGLDYSAKQRVGHRVLEGRLLLIPRVGLTFAVALPGANLLENLVTTR